MEAKQTQRNDHSIPHEQYCDWDWMRGDPGASRMRCGWWDRGLCIASGSQCMNLYKTINEAEWCISFSPIKGRQVPHKHCGNPGMEVGDRESIKRQRGWTFMNSPSIRDQTNGKEGFKYRRNGGKRRVIFASSTLCQSQRASILPTSTLYR